MAAQEAWKCSICHDVRQDVAYVIPCNHMFCAGCIQRWARLSDSCPLCRVTVQAIRVPVQGDDEYVECIVSSPTVPVPVNSGTATATGPDSAEAPLPPPPPPSPELIAAEPERVGGLLPEEWAALLRVRQDILDPVLPWLEQQLSDIHVQCRWQINWLKTVIVSHLCQVGLDRDALVQCLQGMLGPITRPFTEIIVEATQRLCGQEARRLLGLEDHSAAQEQEDRPEDPSTAREQEEGPAAPSGPVAFPQGTVAPGTAPSASSVCPNSEELPGTSSSTLGGVAGEPRPAPSPGEQEQPSEKQDQEAAGPSEQGRSRSSSAHRRGRKRSAGGSQRPMKRRASSAQRAPPPCKRRPPRRL